MILQSHLSFEILDRAQKNPPAISRSETLRLVRSRFAFAVSFAAGYLIHEGYGLQFEFSWGWALTAAAIGILGGAFGALYPALRASNLDAVSALAYD